MSEEATPTAEPQAEAQPQEQVQVTEPISPMAARVREAQPPPDAPASEEEDTGLKDMMVKRLYDDIGLILDEEEQSDKPVPEEEVAKKVEQESAAEPEAKAEPSTEPEPEPETRPRTVVQDRDEFAKDFVDSLREVVRTEVRQPTTQQPEPVVQPEPEIVDDTEGLMDEQKFELELMEAAEKAMPDKYKGHRSRSLKFYKDMEAWVDEQASRDPDFGPENNQREISEYVAKNKPVIDKIDERRIERGLIRDQALREFEEKSSEKFRALEQKTRSIEERPRIQREVEEFRGASLEGDIEALKLISEGKPEQASEKYPMESSVARQVSDHASQIYQDFLEYNRGLSSFHEKKESMDFLDKFLEDQGKFFHQNGGESRNREGRQFLPVADYNLEVSRDASASSRYWTFDAADVRELLAASARSQIKQQISDMEKQIAQYGYTRSAPQSEPQRKEEAQPTAVNPPIAATTPSPGPASSSEIQDPSHPGLNVIDALGLGGEIPRVVE